MKSRAKTENSKDRALSIQLLGKFEIKDCDGNELTPRGRKSRAILAMLAVAPDGIRARHWLQQQLWSDRGPLEAAGSLRQCLTEIRRSLGQYAHILHTDRQSVRLVLANCSIDLEQPETDLAENALLSFDGAIFAEDLDIKDPNFSRWLETQRQNWKRKIASLASQKSSSAAAKEENQGNQIFQTTTAPVQPMVLLLPFVSSSEEASAARELTQHLAHHLHTVRWLRLKSAISIDDRQHSTNKPSLNEVARGCNFAVAGHLLKIDDRWQVTIELLDAQTLSVLWTDFFRPLRPYQSGGYHKMAIEIAGNVATNLGIEAERAFGQTEQNDIGSLIWRGRWQLNHLRRGDADAARTCFRQVVNREPDNIEAQLQLAWCSVLDAWANRASVKQLRDCLEIAERVRVLDASDSRAFWLTGAINCYLRNHEAAIAALQQGLMLSPSMGKLHLQMASSEILSGKPSNALETLKMAWSLSPLDRHRFHVLCERAVAHLLLGNYEESLTAAEGSIGLRSRYWYAHFIKFLALRKMGETERAAVARKRLLEVRPDLHWRDIYWIPFADRQINRSFMREFLS